MKKLIFIFIFSLLLITPCSAAPYDEASLQDSLPDYARNLAGEATQPASEGLERIESAFTETLSGGLSGVIKRSLSIIAVAIICAVLTMFCDDAPEYVSLGGCAAIAIISVSDVNSFVSSGADVITALSGFSKTLLPAMCAASAACGTLSSATVKYAASVLFLDSFVTIAQSVILPVIYAYLAAGIASSSFGSKSLTGYIRTFKACMHAFNDCGSPRLHCVYKHKLNRCVGRRCCCLKACKNRYLDRAAGRRRNNI